ncbi:hypothetical protein CspeluHIS016_0109040 [Cutaneotrichosporon spelunceum]|uniref:WAP domain-containing protein n=1 Tax=Cutaneotrichosporon spelunceum TaxID=1672016 RepID=A0AAD3TPK2_9TREE|nr:hypothetical protein CspeluHIS016_0109040 [Cutaneotrichosporon spelunceum]
MNIKLFLLAMPCLVLGAPQSPRPTGTPSVVLPPDVERPPPDPTATSDAVVTKVFKPGPIFTIVPPPDHPWGSYTEQPIKKRCDQTYCLTDINHGPCLQKCCPNAPDGPIDCRKGGCGYGDV